MLEQLMSCTFFFHKLIVFKTVIYLHQQQLQQQQKQKQIQIQNKKPTTATTRRK
jgi:hypothetical protein